MGGTADDVLRRHGAASGDGHVNVSPKGPIGSLRVLGPRRVAYLDVGGSGAETIAHVRENGRIVIMLCAFEGPPRIVRFHGEGTVLLKGDERFEEVMAEAEFEDPSVPEARRSIVEVDVTRVGDSCGYGVPLMSFEGLREHHALSRRQEAADDRRRRLRRAPPAQQRRQPGRAAGAGEGGLTAQRTGSADRRIRRDEPSHPLAATGDQELLAGGGALDVARAVHPELLRTDDA